MEYKKIQYDNLNARQKENFNFQKVAAVLAEYGFNCMRLSDDWRGADFIACHIDGDFLKIQLKGRLTIDRRYQKREIYIAFPEQGQWYLYPHDDVMSLLEPSIKDTRSWQDGEGYSWPRLSGEIRNLMNQYLIS